MTSFDQTKGAEANDLVKNRMQAIKEALELLPGFEPIDDPLIMCYDVRDIKTQVQNLTKAFSHRSDGSLRSLNAMHTFAIKACPLEGILRLVHETGMGAECASRGEIDLALQLGFAPTKVIWDSPAKTRSDIDHGLSVGVWMNADSLEELNRYAAILAGASSAGGDNKGERGKLGLRVNPQCGAGSIESSSTVTVRSKFGVPIRENREAIIQAFLKYDWLKGLHVHSGSQGCGVELLSQAARILYELAEEINERTEAACQSRRCEFIDIGGGISINYESDREEDRFQEFTNRLDTDCPGLLSGKYQIITENGRSIVGKSGFFASFIESVKKNGDLTVLIQHIGADLLLRTVYLPESWPVRTLLCDPKGDLKQGAVVSMCDVGGPLCFGGDIIARNRALDASVSEGDIILVPDCGAYTISMFSRFNSRQSPAVWSFERDGNKLRWSQMKKKETVEQVMKFWIK